MSLAFPVLMTEAAVLFSTARQYRISKRILKYIHGAVNGLAMVFLFIGLVVVFKNHNHKDIPPLYSAHSWLGIMVTFIAFTQLFATAYYHFIDVNHNRNRER